MKNIHTKVALSVLTISILAGACQKDKKAGIISAEEQAKIETLKKEIHDSIRTFNVNFAKEAIQEGRSLAKDSDDYYDFTMYSAILFFYTSQSDSMLSDVNRVMDYLSKQPTTPRRNQMHIKCLQTKAAYYAQFYLNPDSLVYYSIKACKIAEQEPDFEQQILCYNNLADAYKQKGELAQSANFYRKAIYLADSIHTSKDNYVPLYSGIATTYTALYDFEQSKIWLDKSLELWNLMMTHEKFNYLNDRGNDYYYQGDYINCRSIFLQMDTFLQAHPELEWEKHICNVNLADTYLKLKQPQKADSLLHDGIAFFEPMQYETVLPYLYTLQMELALQKEDRKQVEQLIHKHPLPKGTKPEHALARLDFLQRYYTEKPDWEKACHYQKAYNQLNDSLRNDRVRMNTADLQMRYERDATVLNQKIYIGQKETELLQTYIGLALSIFILLLLLILLYYRRRQTKFKEEQMLHRIVGLRMENIRNRITPHFIYNALNHELLAQQQGKPTQLDTLVNLLRQGQALANVFCTSLKEELDFIQLYVQIEGEALGDDFCCEIILDKEIEPEEVTLPSMMIQIFVENAIKHGLKNLPADTEGKTEKKLMLLVYRKENCICIEVYNSGKPLNLQNIDQKTQNGLRVISQTIQLLNERNKQQMSYSLTEYQNKTGEPGCCAQLIIPENYNFNIN
ncbi:histidine kinase [Bacteroides sp.]